MQNLITMIARAEKKTKITQTLDGQGLWGPCIKKQLKIL
jgi:hypothetical protein